MNQREENDSDQEPQVTNARRSSRTKKRPSLDDYVIYTAATEDYTPEDYNEAISSPAKDKWLSTMKTRAISSLEAIARNNTWSLCDLPANKNLVGCKWVYKIKVDKDYKPSYKARLIAKGYSQVEGQDFGDTYSPVVCFTSLRLLFALAAKLNLDVHHLDIETAFFHGNLDKEIYLAQPDGFIRTGQEDKIYRLHKAFYGLKQGSRVWNKELHEFLLSFNLKQAECDSCIYYYTISPSPNRSSLQFSLTT